jgi:hypothetical protein
MWLDILKNARLGSKPKSKALDTSRLKVNVEDDNCNRKLKEAHDFCEAYAKKIETVIKETIKKINENNPPTNAKSHSDGREGTAPLTLFDKDIDDEITTYRLPTRINRGNLSIYVYRKYEPIDEEAACKLIDMFNSEKAKSTNFYEYDIDPRLETSNKKGSPELGYDYPFNYVAAGAYPKKVNIGISMSRGFFTPYDNQDEHVKQIWDAIRFSDAQQKLNSILR